MTNRPRYTRRVTRPYTRALLGLAAAGALASACDAITSVATTGADFGGATADAHCDRRTVTDGGRPSSFCQEIVGTLAATQFADDCRLKLLATPGPGLCPRENVIAGCKLLKKNDDSSLVWDWYYDVTDTDAGDAGGVKPLVYEPPTPRDTSAVASTCADHARYPDGAELAHP